MSKRSDQQLFNDYLLDLYGDDQFSEVRRASQEHRLKHALSLPGGEQECGVYPSDALKMRVIRTIIHATGAQCILEIGGGLGYSGLWMATAAGEAGHVETIDHFPEHTELIRMFAAQHGLKDRVVVLEGEADAITHSMSGPFDLIHDDGWFAAQPSYYDRLADLLRPGGLLIMSNWFLLEHAVTGDAPLDWSQFAGPAWASDVQDYARELLSDARYEVSFIKQPSMALAYRRPDA